MTAKPWMQFYPSDWKGDSKLRVCSLAARGLWLEMIAIAHEADPYGYVTINGSPITESQLARIVGSTEEEVINLISELDKAGVFSRNRNGIIYSRRMVRDEKKATKNRENGKNGGASKHKKLKGNSDLGNPNLTDIPTEIVESVYRNVNRNPTEQASETIPNTIAPYTRDHIPDTKLENPPTPESTAAREPATLAKPKAGDGGLFEISNQDFRSILIARLQDFPPGLRKTTAEARLTGWLSMLSLEQIDEALDNCKIRNFDRNAVKQYIDSVFQGEAIKRIGANQPVKPKESPKPREDHPDFLAVRDAIVKADKQAAGFFAEDAIKLVQVNGKSVTFGIANRYMTEHLQRVYGSKIAELWTARNPNITEFHYQIAPPGVM